MLVLLAEGCSFTGTKPSVEQHKISQLTVVFLDDESLRQRYAAVTGTAAMSFRYGATPGTLGTVRGFFDSKTNTIYCPKMNFEVCGHELHHAVLGPFHGSD